MMNNEPVAIRYDFDGYGYQYMDSGSGSDWQTRVEGEFLYTHTAKTQLSNGHLSDCAIHNEPASRNKDCDCGFEPKFDLSGLKHEDNCRYFDDELYCSCGADNYALVEWYRHKEVAHPAKTLTDKEMRKVINENVENVTVAEMVMFLTVCKAILRKAKEK